MISEVLLRMMEKMRLTAAGMKQNLLERIRLYCFDFVMNPVNDSSVKLT